MLPPWAAAAAWTYGHRIERSVPVGGSTNPSGWAGKSARRTATSAIARAPGGGLIGQPRRQRPDDDLVGGSPSPARQRDTEELEREGPAGASRRVGRHAGRQVGRHDQRARPDDDRRPGPPGEAVREGVVGEGAVGLDGVGHDLGHRIGREQVDPLEGGHDGALGRPERRRRGREPDIRAAPRGGTVDRATQSG